MDDVIWVRIREWVLVEAGWPTPRSGDVLRSVGVRLAGTVGPADDSVPDGVVEIPGTAGPGRPVSYALTGTSETVRDVFAGATHRRRALFLRVRDEPEHLGAELVLDVGLDRFHVAFDGHASEVDPGMRLTATGQLSLVGDYEWDAFGLPDTRTDWLVTDVVELRGGDLDARLAQPVGG